MTYDDFIQSLQYCQSKSGMSKAIDFPIVFDCHEDGLIYMNSSGEVFFLIVMLAGIKRFITRPQSRAYDSKLQIWETRIWPLVMSQTSHMFISTSRMAMSSTSDVIHIVCQNYYSGGIDVTLLTRSDRELSETDSSIITLIEAGEIRMKRGLS